MCILWFHNWGKWEDVGTSPVWEKGLFSERFKFNQLQHRHCERCGGLQRRKLDQDLIDAEREMKFQETLLKLRFNIK